MSQTIVAKIKKLIQLKSKFAPKECEVAMIALDQIPRQRTKQRSSYTGIISHPILENIFRKILLNLGIISHHEKFINKPYSYHRIDTSIEIISPKQRKLIRLLDPEMVKCLGLNFREIREIYIDFNIPSKRHIGVILDKIEKYAKEGCLLFIAFYGKYSNKIFQLTREYLVSLDNDTYKKDNIFFIDILDLAKLFLASLDKDVYNKYVNDLVSLNTLIINSLQFKENSIEDLEHNSENAIYELESSNTFYLE